MDLAAVLIALEVQKRLDDRRMKLDRKMAIFRKLMTARPTQLSPAYVEALNPIEVEFYCHAINSGMVSQYVLFAKALDLARDMLPGHGHSNKEKKLPAKVRAALRQSLAWVGKMSNERLETRHIASGGKLLPRMSRTESADFVHDASA